MNDTAVLTYHRMIDTETKPAFYDVPWAVFERHVALIAARTASVDGMWIRLDNGRSVMVSLDDSTADHARAGEILARYDLPGTFFVVTGRVETEGSLTVEGIKTLAAANHHIGSHAVTHGQLPTLDQSALEAELSDSKVTLEAMVGRPVTWLALPGGAYDKRVLAAAEAAGYEVVRSMDWGYTSRSSRGLTRCLPVFRSYDEEMVERLIDGRAPLWRYHAKTTVKNLVPDRTYQRLRALSMRGR